MLVQCTKHFNMYMYICTCHVHYLFHCPIQGPHALARTIAPMSFNGLSIPSRSIVALICSDPGVTVNWVLITIYNASIDRYNILCTCFFTTCVFWNFYRYTCTYMNLESCTCTCVILILKVLIVISNLFLNTKCTCNIQYISQMPIVDTCITLNIHMYMSTPSTIETESSVGLLVPLFLLCFHSMF